MNYLTRLNEAVNATLTANRIGTPVFVRWTAATAAITADLKPQLAALTGFATRWLAADLRRLYATGTEASGHLSLALEYASGASALLALTLAHDRPQVNLAIYGNQGAVYHNEFIVPARDGSLAAQPADGQTRAGLLAMIEASLQTGQPVQFPHSGGQP